MGELSDVLLGACWLGRRPGSAGAGACTVMDELEGPRARAGAARTATYSAVAPGADMDRVKAQLNRMDGYDDDAVRDPDWLVLTEYDSLSGAVAGERMLREAASDDRGVRVLFHSIFRPYSYLPGPEEDDSGEFAPVVQLGTYVMRRPDDEWDLLDWYVRTKLPPFRDLTGGVRVRPLVSACGPTKFGVLYEFVSLETRIEHFERVHEVRALDRESETGRVVSRILHAPMSPTVGRRDDGARSGR